MCTKWVDICILSPFVSGKNIAPNLSSCKRSIQNGESTSVYYRWPWVTMRVLKLTVTRVEFKEILPVVLERVNWSKFQSFQLQFR